MYKIRGISEGLIGLLKRVGLLIESVGYPKERGGDHHQLKEFPQPQAQDRKKKKEGLASGEDCFEGH